MANVNLILPAFGITWAEDGTIATVDEAQWKAGWAFIGATPPSVEQFNKVMQVMDQKSNYLYGQLLSIMTLGGQTPNVGDPNSTRNALQTSFAVGRLLRTSVYSVIGGVQNVSINGGAPTTTGAGTFTSLAGPSRARVRVLGGGGGGGGAAANAAGFASVGGAGGAGGYSESLLTGPLTGIVVTVGLSANGGGSGGGSGGAGYPSSFGALLTAGGGGAGSYGSSLNTFTTLTSGGGGGLGVSGNIMNARGQPGGIGNAFSPSSLAGGPGGSSIFGAGGGATGGSVGEAGVSPGSGGSGASSPASTAARAGGAGAAGLVIVEEYA